MNITLTVQGTLTEDPALREIISVLSRRAAAKPAKQVQEPTATVGAEPFGELFVAREKESEKPAGKPAVENPEFEAAVAEMTAEPKQEPRAEVSFATVAKAASEAINSGKREGFASLLKSHGVQTLAEIPQEEYQTMLDEIGAL